MNEQQVSTPLPCPTLQQEIANVLKNTISNYKGFAALKNSGAINEKSLTIRRMQGGKHDAHFAIELPFYIAKPLSMPALEVAKQLATLLRPCTFTNNSSEEKQAMFSLVDACKPGFVNVKLSYYYCSYLLVAQQNSSLEFRFLAEEKILLEYVSANPTGPLHIGHGRWAVVGSCLANVLRQSGADVLEEYYINNGGAQIGLLNESVKALRSGTPIPENGYQGEYLQRFKMFDNPSDAILEEQKLHLKNIGTSFQSYFKESTLIAKNKNFSSVNEVLTRLEKMNLAYWKDDALWFSSTKGGDDKDRVLIKSNGNKTYFAMDIAYHFTKITRGYNHLINIFGADHHGYVARITTACKLMYNSLQESNNNNGKDNYDKESNTKSFSMDILIGQLVSLFRSGHEVRMSKRTGDMVVMQEVVDEIGADAFRFFLLIQSLNKKIDFDLMLAKEKSMENPVYYLQYAYARSHSVVEKSRQCNLQPCSANKFNIKSIASKEVDELVNLLLFYRNEVKLIATSLGVHHLPHYLKQLASAFHTLYNAHAFIRLKTSEEKNISGQYLFLVQCFQKVLENGLSLMGISAPKKM